MTTLLADYPKRWLGQTLAPSIRDETECLFSRLHPKHMIAEFVLIAAALCSAERSARAADPAEDFVRHLRTKVAAAETKQKSVILGQNGWMFFVPELRSLSVGPFWFEEAVKVSRSSKAEYADPFPAIVDFHDQLHKAGIELLVVPVPAKAAVCPEQLEGGSTLDAIGNLRYDPYQRRFYDILEQRGVTVVDLLPTFVQQSDDKRLAMYCRTDSHWSGAAVALAAMAIAERLEDRPWWRELRKTEYATEAREVEISGDLNRMLNEARHSRERLELIFVGSRQDQALAPIESDRASPVVLIGDSHTLVFHDPDLFARGAGLPDHLALRLGVAVDLVGVRGSGATTTRIDLLRRRDNLNGKKVVIWCFSVREFTESFTGWRKVPVIR